MVGEGKNVKSQVCKDTGFQVSVLYMPVVLGHNG